MITFKQKEYRKADYEGLDFLGRREMKRERNKLAKKLKAHRKATNNLMPEGLNRGISNDLALDSAKSLKEGFAKKIREKSGLRDERFRKYGKKGVLAATLIGGGYGLYKIANSKPQDSY